MVRSDRRGSAGRARLRNVRQHETPRRLAPDPCVRGEKHPRRSEDPAPLARNASGVKTLYILGMTRSGSTILENVLGNVPGFFAAGEIHWLWRSLVAGVPCGCRRPIDDCPVWGP